ncbi:hypothetical protein R3P38DRAFT_3004065 [Favolaschia claudopus]|uniref:F-box domain-containing protein n=1 Tax=Favolaschia claudopus TaxID=2862362 RepID=A0AAW0ALY9_9AGAR
MHPCLEIPEIQSLICDEFDASPYRMSSSPPTLAALARSCKSFTETALRTLWRKQTTLSPLLRLMPSNLLKRPLTQLQRLLRPIMAADWDRVILYAPWVKHLTMSHAAWFEIAEILPMLSACSSSGFIFPCLLEFNFHVPSSDDNVASIRTFLPPTLTKLGYSCRFTVSATSLLSVIPSTCPSVRRVELYVVTVAGLIEPGPAISSFLGGLHCLVSLSMYRSECTLPTILHLGQLSTLTCLELSSIPAAVSSIPSDHPLLFPSLRRLAVFSIEVGLASGLITRCTNAHLASLSFTFASHATHADLELLYDALRKSCSHKTLQRLELQDSETIASPPTGSAKYGLTRSLLNKLSVFSALEYLSIRTFSLDIDDKAVAELTTSWPELTSLELAAIDIELGRAEPQLTLRSLSSIANNCPDLTSLDIQLNATAVDFDNENENWTEVKLTTPLPARVLNGSLGTLDVELSPITDPPAVARFLSGLFPNLRYITTNYENHADSDEELAPVSLERHALWKQVQEQIPHFVAARREALVWGALGV